MQVLLDTNYLLWATGQPDRLPHAARDLMEATQNTVYFSAASIWEIAIKAALRRQDFRAQPDKVAEAAETIGFLALPITWQDTIAVARLPNHHRDPFDRLLVAQAMALPARLLTADSVLARYSELVWVQSS